MKGFIFEILTSELFQDDSLVVVMAEPQHDGRILVKGLGEEGNRSRLIPLWNLKNYNSI